MTTSLLVRRALAHASFAAVFATTGCGAESLAPVPDVRAPDAGVRAADTGVTPDTARADSRVPSDTARPDSLADPELERTWQAAPIYAPGGGDRVLTGQVGHLAELQRKLPAGRRFPTIVYSHGCSGIDGWSRQTATLLARWGYVVFLPNSFRRRVKPKSCDPKTNKGGLHRAVLGWRQAELVHALRRAKRVAFVEARNVFAFGLSEGGTTVATFVGEAVNARVIEGWGCHAGWPEYKGLKAPASEPTLSFVGDRDPWFYGRPAVMGDCGTFMNKTNGSRSVVYQHPDTLAKQHFLTRYARAQAILRPFLAKYHRR